MGIVIDNIGGNCPVQAEGKINNFPFYFRARGNWCSLTITLTSGAEWEYGRKYSDEPYAAGWMKEDEAKAFIEEAALKFEGDCAVMRIFPNE